jgi:hypothetical protein
MKPIPVIPMTYKAEIRTDDGWWFRYIVHRTVGIFIPENSVTIHRTLNGAQRAARRWTRRNGHPPARTVERHGYPTTATASTTAGAGRGQSLASSLMTPIVLRRLVRVSELCTRYGLGHDDD